jgi:hypothetical protein
VWTVLENGEPARKVDLLILGDGYATAEMDDFHRDVEAATADLFSVEPYASRRADFNVRAIDTPAPEPGVSRPRAGVFRETPLGARYNSLDSERYVLSLDDRAWRDVAAAAPYDAVLILVNSRQYGWRRHLQPLLHGRRRLGLPPLPRDPRVRPRLRRPR